MSDSTSTRADIPRFWRRSSVQRMLLGFSAVFAVIGLGVIGYVVLGWNAFDALFMVVITISGVGFGEVRPMGSSAERIHTMLIIALGMIAVAYTIAGFVQFLTEGEIQRLLGRQRMRRQIEMLNDHVVVAGFGRVGSLVCGELTEAGIPIVVIEQAPARLGDIERLSYLYVAGDATEETTLREAGLERAKVLVTA